MFLFQKLNYNVKFIGKENNEGISEVTKFLEKMLNDKPIFTVFDTESSGLDIQTDKIFLKQFGYGKDLLVMEPNPLLTNLIYDALRSLQSDSNYLGMFAHNCKFDWHMLDNSSLGIPEDIKLFDSITVARLTEYADNQESLSLETLGSKYVDESSKFAGKIIKELQKKINLKNKNIMKKKFKQELGSKLPLTKILKSYDKRVPFIKNEYEEYFEFISNNYTPATYEDVYKENKNLMISYAADDLVIMIEYLNKALPILEKIEGLKVLRREGQLIPVVAKMEKQGFNVDVEYILSCRVKVVEYINKLYKHLGDLTNVEFTVGQEKIIKLIYLKKYGMMLQSTDEKALKLVIELAKDEEPKEVARTIMELRTLDKWLSTYIDGKLKAIINGRIYATINNNGAVSGRVSSNMQQQPKDGLYTRDGEELFHPRRMFIADDGCKFVFIDESQMELRYQAYYTMDLGSPDDNLCRAYIPMGYFNQETLETFDYHNNDHLNSWNQLKSESPDLHSFKNGLEEALEKGWSIWENENGPWTPTDLHSTTTLNAFPHLVVGTPEFKKYRKLGKTCNFLKVYQGGVNALKDSLDIDFETARKLDEAFYKSFPRIKDYQKWVNDQLTKYGYVENLYGRRYYMQDSRQFYKVCNYLIQGGCADMMKQFQIDIYKYLNDNKLKTKMVLPIHDEIIFSVPNDELHIIPKLKELMEDTRDIIKTMPMVAEVEIADHNWRDKKGFTNV